MKKHHRDHKQMVQEQAWIDLHRETLRNIGVFPIAYLDYDHWRDFLENGEIHFHADPSGFNFENLVEDQRRRLLAFLEQEYGQNAKVPPLLGWLRARFPSSG